MKFLLLLLLVFVPAIFASASTEDPMGWRQDGHPVANTDARKAVSGFGASIIITPDADWESKWNTPAETSPKFTTIEKLKIGERATILIFFANPKQDAAGSVDVTCDVKITRPNNQITDNHGLKGFTGKLRGPVTNSYLTEAVICFVGEPTDPLGEWIVDVTVHDNNRHVSIPLRSKFSLSSAAVATEPPMSEKALNEWMTNYYLHPTPESTSLAIQSMQQLSYLKKESAGAPLASFLSLIFRSNPAAIETSLESFTNYSPEEQQILLRSLWLSNTKQAKIQLEKLITIQVNNGIHANADLLKSDPPEIDKLPINSPDILDMLWGAFMATGDEKYVIQVISVLPYSTIKGDVARLIVGESARWSLTSNAIQHKRVLDICISQLDKQTKEVKAILSEVITEATKEKARGEV
jgi:hypothetical protein